MNKELENTIKRLEEEVNKQAKIILNNHHLKTIQMIKLQMNQVTIQVQKTRTNQIQVQIQRIKTQVQAIKQMINNRLLINLIQKMKIML